MSNHLKTAVNAEKLISELGILHVNRYMANKYENLKNKHRKENPLSLWTENAVCREALISYVR